jgi:hypothetical protein
LPRHLGFRASGFALDPSLDFPGLARDFLRQQRARDGRELVGAVVHHHFDELPRIWPRARFIHLLRDPRDVARSWIEMGFAGNAWSGAGGWLAATEAWSRLRAAVPSERCLEVRFEDLVRDAEPVLRRITDFLGVAYDPAMLQIERDTTYRRPDPSAARSFREGAPEREVREVEARVGPRLAESGYAPSGLPPLRIGRFRELALRVGDRWGRARFAWRRIGPGLWAAAVVSRRLPFLRLRERVQLRIDAIQLRHLK